VSIHENGISDDDFREAARHFSKESLSDLSTALFNTLEGDESLVEEGVQEMKDVLAHTYVQGENIFEGKDLFRSVPMFLVAGLYGSATPEIMRTVSKLRVIAKERVSKRTIQGRINREKEGLLLKSLTAYRYAVSESLNNPLARGDVDTCRILCHDAIESPFVCIRVCGMGALKDLLPQARAKGIELIPDQELWILLDRIEKQERRFLDNPYGDFIVSPFDSQQILTFISDIRDFYLDPEGKVHNLTPRRDMIMIISH